MPVFLPVIGIALQSCSKVRCIGGGAITSTEGASCWGGGGSGGMQPRKILKYRVSEIAF